MNAELITAFLTLVEYENFTLAAEKLCLTQSALSHRVNLLEKEISEVLITRSRGKRGINLTEAGIDFIPLAEKYLNFDKSITNFKNNRRFHSLTIGNVESFSYMFGKLYRQIALNNNQEIPVLIHNYTYPSFHIINEVEQQNIDIGFTVRQRIGRNLNIKPLFSEKHYLIGDLGTDKKNIDPCHLDRSKEILSDWSQDYHFWHDSYIGSDHHPFAVAGTCLALLELMTKNTWCIIPESFIHFLQSTCALKGIKVNKYNLINPPPNRICYKLTHKYPSTITAETLCYFEDLLKKFLQKNDLHM